jgi:hypothetical protein
MVNKNKQFDNQPALADFKTKIICYIPTSAIIYTSPGQPMTGQEFFMETPEFS